MICFRTAPVLDSAERAEVEGLAAVCASADGTPLPLFLAPDSNRPEGEGVQLLYREGGPLLGFGCGTPTDPSEVTLIVHPGHRRRGVGRRLLEAARVECRRIGFGGIQLTCDRAIPAGGAFARAVGGILDFSEYVLEMDPEAVPDAAAHERRLSVTPVGPEHAETLALIRAAAFGHPWEESQERVHAWISSPDQRFYLGRLDGKGIGSLRAFLQPDEGTVWLNTFGVLPEFQGRGCGREILSGAVDHLREEGWERIIIEVNVENPSALGLYRSCGFREVTAIDYFRLDV